METRQWFETINAENSQKRDCLKDKTELEEMIEKTQKELLDLRDDHRHSKERVNKLEVELPGKVDDFKLIEVSEFMQLLPTREEVSSLRNHMKNNIDKFGEDNIKFKNEFEGHLEIIRRYDEVISEKANKHSVSQVESRINENYKPVIKNHDDRIGNNLKLINETRDCFAEFKDLMQAEIYSAVKKSVIKEIKIYEHEKKKSQP